MENNISQIFKEARNTKKWSQEEMALFLGCSRVLVSLIETGKIKNPGTDKFMKVMSIFPKEG